MPCGLLDDGEGAAADEIAGELEAVGWLRACAAEPRDPEAARRSEDDFDALLTAAALLRLVAEGRPLSCELVDPAVEGGILGTGGVSLPFVPMTFSP